MKKQIKKFISSTVDFHDLKNALNIASELGCGVEISRFGKLKEIETSFEKTKKEYSSLLKDFDNEVTLHGFFSNLNVASKDPLIKEASIKRYNQSFELACEFNARTVVFHTCYNNLLRHSDYQRLFFKENVEFFRDFIKNFEQEGIIATVENVHEPNFDFIKMLLLAVNSPNLKATIDIGHVNLHSDILTVDWIKEYGIMLHHMHLHNNFKDEDSHSSLLRGDLEFEPILQTLKEMYLYPEFTFEIFDEEHLRESVQYFDELCKKIDY